MHLLLPEAWNHVGLTNILDFRGFLEKLCSWKYQAFKNLNANYRDLCQYLRSPRVDHPGMTQDIVSKTGMDNQG